MATTTAQTLNTFVNLTGSKVIPEAPPAWDTANQGPAPDKRARLRAFAAAYRAQQANPATATDFPATNTKGAWVDSFNAWEKIRMVAHAIERQDNQSEPSAPSAVN